MAILPAIPLPQCQCLFAGNKDGLLRDARRIYAYIRDNFTCGPDQDIYVSDDLYRINKARKGAVEDLNMLLIAMLREKRINASPDIRSTKPFGTNPARYPGKQNAIDELPRSAKVAYNGDEGFFEYLIQASGTNVQMRSHIKLNKAYFPQEDYNSLRDLFAYVVKKQTEQIVFKKKK